MYTKELSHLSWKRQIFETAYKVTVTCPACQTTKVGDAPKIISNFWIFTSKLIKIVEGDSVWGVNVCQEGCRN